jgi:phage tail-like protein
VSEPFTAHCFRVDIVLPDSKEPLCDAAFAECDGLELRFDVRSLREGGNNAGPVLLAGGASYGEVTLRRGMTSSFDLWDWCGAVLNDPGLRADAVVTVLAPDLATTRARFRLRRCLPVRLKAPRLDALDGAVAIEELQLACEGLQLERPDGDGTPPPGPQRKAELHELDARMAKEINPERAVRTQLNPAGLRLVSGAAEPAPRLELELWFESPAGDVQELTQRVAYFAGPPPRALRFQWGTFRFDGHVEALVETLELFSPDGRPLRARLALTLRGGAVAQPA